MTLRDELETAQAALATTRALDTATQIELRTSELKAHLAELENRHATVESEVTAWRLRLAQTKSRPLTTGARVSWWAFGGVPLLVAALMYPFEPGYAIASLFIFLPLSYLAGVVPGFALTRAHLLDSASPRRQKSSPATLVQPKPPTAKVFSRVIPATLFSAVASGFATVVLAAPLISGLGCTDWAQGVCQMLTIVTGVAGAAFGGVIAFVIALVVTSKR